MLKVAKITSNIKNMMVNQAAVRSAVSFLVNVLANVLAPGLLVVVYYYAVSLLVNMSQSIILDTNLPIDLIFAVSFPLIFFILPGSDFVKLPFKIWFSTCAILAVITYFFGILAVVLFCVTTLVILNDAYGHTSDRWKSFSRIFVAFFWTTAVMHFSNLNASFYDTVLLGVLFSMIAVVYPLVTACVHGKGNQAFSRNDGETTERYDQPGDAEVQFRFVRRRRRVVLFSFLLSAWCTFGQLRPSRIVLEAETTSSVLCKSDQTKDVECVVDVTYYGVSESEDLCSANSSQWAQWDFCGALFRLCVEETH